jgi:hypothetical protein
MGDTSRLAFSLYCLVLAHCCAADDDAGRPVICCSEYLASLLRYAHVKCRAERVNAIAEIIHLVGSKMCSALDCVELCLMASS